MSYLIPPDPSGLFPVIGKEIGKPFAKEIFLVATHIAGTMHVEQIEQALENVAVGTRLFFFREIDNLYDSQAIMIKNQAGEKLGYVPKKNNEIIANLMDAGKLIYGVLEGSEQIGDWHKLTIQIFMND